MSVVKKYSSIWGSLLLVILIGGGVYFFGEQRVNQAYDNQKHTLNEQSVSQTPDDFSLVSNSELPSTDLTNIYHIWVRSYQDSNGDGIGDIAGVISRLSYLEELGVSAILLSPIFPSPSYHGYEVTNFESIHVDIGTKDDFLQLISSAREKGIDIYLDIAINHTSDQHPWFIKSIAGESPYDDYYIWRDTLPQEYGFAWEESASPSSVWHTKAARAGAYYYGAFGFASPDLNYKNTEITDEIYETLEYWILQGVKGFRIDAARYLIETGPLSGQRDTPENLQALNSLLNKIKDSYPGTTFIGEVFAGTDITPQYLREGAGLDGVFNFEFTYAVYNALQFTAGEEPVFDVETSINTLKNFYKRAKQVSSLASNQVAFLSNHDIGRHQILKESLDMQKIALSLLLMSPLTPSVYYGDEVGLYPYDNTRDVYKRDLMQWTSSLTWAGFSDSKSVWIDNADYFTWLDNPKQWGLDKLTQQLDRNVLVQKNDKQSLLNHTKYLTDARARLTEFSDPKRQYSVLDIDNLFGISLMSNEKTLFILINVDPTHTHHVSKRFSLEFEYKNLLNGNIIHANDLPVLSPGDVLLLKRQQLKDGL